MSNPQDTLIELSAETVDALLTRLIPVDLPATLYPGHSHEIASQPEVAQVCYEINKAVKNGAGYSILKIDSERALDHHQMKVAYWNLFTSLGSPLAQYLSGEMFYEVRMSETPSLMSHYSRTNRGGGFHTDGTFLMKTPFYAGLICLRQAESGGESIFIDGRKVYDRLRSDFPEALARLKQDYVFDCCGQMPGLEYRPQAIISETRSSLLIKYLRAYINEGYSKAGLSLDSLGSKSLDVLDELLDDPDLQFIYKINAGEMLIFNNFFMLHGRKPFFDGNTEDAKRLLIRVYAEGEPEN
jgi:alpha-ketoglutarate-dependent taurine dioxygenase